MCGIVGYTGKRQAQPVLLSSLARLEYRGYDSCGIAIGGEGVSVYKDAVRIKTLSEVCPLLPGNIGIGHTRWATHGPPSLRNAHPHLDCSGRFAVVHNGVITNYEALKRRLIAEGHRFSSETDTEVIAHLIEKYYSGDLEGAVTAALSEVEGSYAVAVLAAGCDWLIAARKDSPLIIGLGDGENIVASDVPAMLDYTNTVLYLENGDVAVVRAGGVKVKNAGREVERPEQKIGWKQADVEKGGYEHYMLKEIYEQPRVIRDTLDELANSEPGLLTDSRTGSISILACGTSYHAGLIGKNVIETLCNIPVKVEIASEFHFEVADRAPAETFAITQSGETADVISAIRKLKEAGIGTTVITNVHGSTASRLAARTLYTRAGPEVSVAATKTFIAQLVMLYGLAMSYPSIGSNLRETLFSELIQLPRRVEQVLAGEGAIKELAGFIAGFDSVFFIGRGISYPVALEGALKLKEVSYIHAEGCPAGELKHGPFALLTEKTPVVAVLAGDKTYGAMLTSLKEVKARNAPVIAVAPESDQNIAQLADYVITVPDSRSIFSPLLNTVALQLLAYYAARSRGCSIDFPRNLAKSVTVE